MRSVAQTLGHEFVACGCRYVFGLPGGETLDLMEGLRQAGLEFVLTRHETAAAIMAATVGDLTPQPGLCMSTLGPGATNMLTGVAQAHLDRSPLVAMSAQIPAARQSILSHQMIDLPAMYAPVCKWAVEVNAANVSRTVRKALQLTQAGRPGPVHLSIPSDVPAQEAVAEPAPFPDGDASMRTVRPRMFSPSDLDGVRAVILSARRPAVIVGAGAHDHAVAALRFIEWLGCPVYDLPKAKGAFPESHPQFIGTLEMAGTAALFDQLRTADLILSLGVDPVEYDRWWDFPARVLTFDEVPNNLLYTPSHFDIVGSWTVAAEGLMGGIPSPADQWIASDFASLRGQMDAVVQSEARPGLLHPRRVIQELRAVLSEDAILASDTGAHKMAAGQFWHTSRPRSYLVSNGLSTMGYAIPAAIAARLVVSERPVVAISGDGGFLMSMGEIETACRLGLSLLVVVMVDGALGSIRLNQRRRGYPGQGVNFGSPDFVAFAQAMGGSGWDVESTAELSTALREALARPGVHVIAAHIDGDAYRL